MTTTLTSSEHWVDSPFRRLIDDARLRSGVLLLTSGKVVAQAGFTRADDVMSICALASAIYSSSRELGRQLEGKPFSQLHHAGGARQLYMGQCKTGGRDFIFVGVFDTESSVGLVEMYFGDFARGLEESWNSSGVAADVRIGDFEGDLNRSLDALFGPIE